MYDAFIKKMVKLSTSSLLIIDAYYSYSIILSWFGLIDNGLTEIIENNIISVSVLGELGHGDVRI